MGVTATVTLPPDRGSTIPALFLDTVDRLADRVALRQKVLGRWVDMTWAEYRHRAAAVGLGLRSLGLEPGDRVAVLGENCPEWLTIDLGIQGVGGVTVGMYTTSASEQCSYVLSHSEAAFLFVENEEQLDKWLAVRDDLPAVRRVFVWDDTGLRDFHDPLVWSLDDLIRLGEQEIGADPSGFDRLAAAVSPDAPAIIVYTSGTTGPPKGAVLSHANLVWIGRALSQLDPALQIDTSDEVMSFLPLCHIFERLFSVLVHVTAGYTVNFVEGQDTVALNLRELSPTVLYAVPRLWEKIASSITIRMADATWLKRQVYAGAMRIGMAAAPLEMAGQPLPPGLRVLRHLADWTVFRVLRRRLGFDRARFAITGAAPISPDVLRFYWAIGLRLYEGYGQTESSGVISGPRGRSLRPGTVGQPLDQVEVTLAPDGEILVRSPGVFQGYFRNPDATAQALADGWLHTGDVGEIDDDGAIRIVDRKKDLIITAGGKNVAPQYIENKLKFSPYITDAVVIGDRRKYLTALIVLDEDNVVKFAQDHKIPYSTYAELADDQEINRLIAREIEQVNREVSRVESVRKFRILPRRLYEEDGDVTPTMKVKRTQINDTYRHLIEEMYAD